MKSKLHFIISMSVFSVFFGVAIVDILQSSLLPEQKFFLTFPFFMFWGATILLILLYPAIRFVKIKKNDNIEICKHSDKVIWGDVMNYKEICEICGKTISKGGLNV